MALEFNIVRDWKLKNAWNNMAGASFWSGKRLQNQNVNSGKARDLHIQDHVSQLTISEDTHGKQSTNISLHVMHS